MAAAANLASFRSALTRCGIPAGPSRDAIVQNGWNNMEDFSEQSETEIDTLAKSIARLPAVNGNPVMIPSRALKRLKAMRCWTIWRLRRNLVIVHADFDENGLQWAVERMAHEKRIKAQASLSAAKPDALKNLTYWRPFWKQFDGYCQGVRGTMFLPLSYVYRKNAAADEDDDEVYADSDEQMAAMVVLEGDDYKADNGLLWELFRPLVLEGAAWSFVKKFERTKDGRGAILALQSQAEGNAVDQTRKAEAYQVLENTEFSGASRRFTYLNYVEKLQGAFSELLDCQESVPETRKVNIFLRGLKAQNLESTSTHIMGSPSMMNDFEKAHAYVQMVISTKKTFESEKSGNGRNVSAIEGGAGTKRVHSGSYSPADWYALSETEKDEVRRQRGNEGGGNGKRSNKKFKGNPKNDKSKKKIAALQREVAQLKKGKTATASDSDPDDAGASAQFGRQAHKKKIKSA